MNITKRKGEKMITEKQLKYLENEDKKILDRKKEIKNFLKRCAILGVCPECGSKLIVTQNPKSGSFLSRIFKPKYLFKEVNCYENHRLNFSAETESWSYNLHNLQSKLYYVTLDKLLIK